MTAGQVDRRGWLRGVGVAGGLAATGLVVSAGPAAADDSHDGEGGGRDVAGSWLVEVVNDRDEQTRSVLSFAAGDVAVVHDILPAGPPWTGTWASRPGSGFRATVWTGFPGDQGPGSPGGTAVLRLRGGTRRGRIRGTFEATVFAPDGTPVDSLTGSFSGERIPA